MTRTLLRPVKSLLRRFGRSVVGVGDDIILLADGPEDERLSAYWRWMTERHLGELLVRLQCDCIVDAGANVGGFGAMTRRAGWTGPILSFEPQSSCQPALAVAAHGDRDWQLFAMALSDHDGTVEIALRSSTALTSLQAPRLTSRITAEPGFLEQLDHVGSETVPMRRLDAVMAEMPAGQPERIYLKIDTQGHDAVVLKGASGIMSRVVALQLELSQDPLYEGTPLAAEVMESVRRMGFALNAIFPVFRDPASQALLEFDGIFVRDLWHQGAAP